MCNIYMKKAPLKGGLSTVEYYLFVLRNQAIS
jgi:hypothetical protein